MMDHQTTMELISYDYQLQCFFSYLAVNCRCINFIFNMGDKPVKPLYHVDSKSGENMIDSYTFTTHIV